MMKPWPTDCVNENPSRWCAYALMTESLFEHQAPQKAVKEYWGLTAICRRMNWKNSRTAVRQSLNHGFPLYLKTRAGQTRLFYYSTEQLITSWEWSRCEREIERLIRNTPLPNGAPAYGPTIQQASQDIPNK